MSLPTNDKSFFQGIGKIKFEGSPEDALSNNHIKTAFLGL